MTVTKIDNVSTIPVRNRKSSVLVKRDKGTNSNYVEYHADLVMKDTNVSFVHRVVFKAIDKISPKLKNHSKIANLVMNLSEKFIKTFGNI